jgi:hypothetical protein
VLVQTLRLAQFVVTQLDHTNIADRFTISTGHLFFVSLNGTAILWARVLDELAQIQLRADFVEALFLATLGTDGFTLLACGRDTCWASVSALAIFVAKLLALFLLVVLGNTSIAMVKTVLARLWMVDLAAHIVFVTELKTSQFKTTERNGFRAQIQTLSALCRDRSTLALVL